MAPAPRPITLTHHLARAYVSHRLPATSLVLRACGALDQPRWAAAPTVTSRERSTGGRMRLDLTDRYQRLAWFRGCYHELEIVRTIARCLSPGDRAMDGGANIGLLTMVMARVIGPRGLVVAVEPGPAALERLRWHVDNNSLCNVRVEPVGLSDAPGERTHTVPDLANLGAGTLGPLPPGMRPAEGQSSTIRCVAGDALLDPQDDRPLLIKLDVEGFEMRALHGLRRTLDRCRPAVLTEINRRLLRLNGTTPRRLAALLGRLGYRPFALRQSGSLRARRLDYRALDPTQIGSHRDVLFLHPDSIHWARMARRLRTR